MCECPGAPRRVFTAESLCKGGCWKDKDYPTYQDLFLSIPFPNLETQCVTSGVPALVQLGEHSASGAKHPGCLSYEHQSLATPRRSLRVVKCQQFNLLHFSIHSPLTWIAGQ